MEDQEFNDDDGEELFEVDERDAETTRGNAGRGRDLGGRRLSRDLEEGFRDDSEDEGEGGQRGRIDTVTVQR